MVVLKEQVHFNTMLLFYNDMCELKVKVLVTQLCPALCSPMDCNSPGSSVHGILQARILEWVAISSPGDLPDPGIEPVSCIAGGLFMADPLGKP